MPVQEFECQIARGQIGRYLNGEGISNEGLRHLGVHVAECSGCKKFLDQRKATLQGMLGETPMPEQESTRAVVGVNPSEALIAQIRARSVEVEPEPAPEPAKVAPKPKPIITKPLMYCGALALVLVGMTYVSRNMTGFLGQNAAQAIASNVPLKQAAPPVAAEPTPEAPKTTPETKPAPEVAPVATADTTSKKPDSTAAKPTPPVADDKKSATPDPESTSTPTDATDSPKAEASAEKDADTAKPGIEPTAKGATSPISITPTTSKPTATKPAAKPAAKPKAKANRWHRKWRAHRKNGLYNLKPGTAAIHVYSN